MVNQLPGDQQQVGVNEIRNKINELILSGATVDVSQFPPSNPGEGDLWFDTTLAEIYIYLGSPTNAWVQASNTSNTSGGSGSSGSTGNTDGNFGVGSRYRAAVFKTASNTWYFTSARTNSGVMVDQATFIGNLYLSDELSILSASNGDFCVASTMRAAVFKSSNNTWYFTSSASTSGVIADQATFLGDARTTAENMKISSINGNFCVTSAYRAAVFKSSNNTWYFTSARTNTGGVVDQATYLGDNYSKPSTNVN